MMKNIIVLILFIFTLNCGFKPIHKMSGDDINYGSYSVKIQNSVSREIIDEINTNIITNGNERFIALLKINESLTPLIINTNGTVAKYRVEISFDYELIEIETNEKISTGTARGFAQYDVGTSEISNEETKKSMVKIATANAVQLMASKIQSNISQINDN